MDGDIYTGDIYVCNDKVFLGQLIFELKSLVRVQSDIFSEYFDEVRAKHDLYLVELNNQKKVIKLSSKDLPSTRTMWNRINLDCRRIVIEIFQQSRKQACEFFILSYYFRSEINNLQYFKSEKYDKYIFTISNSGSNIVPRSGYGTCSKTSKFSIRFLEKFS